MKYEYHKNMSTFVSIVSPLYNDASTMPSALPLLERLAGSHFSRWEIVLIDDGSQDNGPAWIRRYVKERKHIHVYFHQKNQGIAKTYRELYARTKGDVIVLFSLDGGWDPSDAVRLAQNAIDDQLDIVVGVRKKKSYTLWRSVVSICYNCATRFLFGVDTKDAGSIKAIRKEVIQKIPIVSRGVFDEAERIIKAKRLGFRIGYLPVSHSASRDKKRRGIRPQHVIEALDDLVSVLKR